MNNQGTQKNPVRKAKTSGQIRRPLSHRVMSMLLTFLMVFTTVMPYTAFAEDSVLTDGAGDMELVGVSSGANGTEAEIVDASGDGDDHCQQEHRQNRLLFPSDCILHILYL